MPVDEFVLELNRVLPARRERVFEFFSAAALLSEWWGPSGFSVSAIDFVPRVGATYRIEMQPPDGDVFELTGKFREVDPPSRLAFTFEWKPPDPDDEETLAQLTFEAADDSTRVHLRQGPFKTQERRALHQDGWSESFDKLAARLVE